MNQYLRTLLLALAFRTCPAGYTRPGAADSLEWCLYSTVPADDGTGGVECAGGGYAAQAVSALDAAMALNGDIVSNVAAVKFPAAVPLSAQITVAGWGLRRTDGTILVAQPALGLPYIMLAAADDTLTRTGQPFVDQQPVRITALDSTTPLPPGLAANTTYYVRDSAANQIKLSATIGGPVIDITAAGACVVRKYFGGTFNIDDQVVIPAGEFKIQLPAPLA